MKRIEWVDFAKGIGIVLVVLGHTGPFGHGYPGSWIGSFHMPGNQGEKPGRRSACGGRNGCYRVWNPGVADVGVVD